MGGLNCNSVVITMTCVLYLSSAVLFMGSLADDDVVKMDVREDVGPNTKAEIAPPAAFTFFQCDDAESHPIQIKKFSLSPDPMVLPGYVKLKLSFKVTEPIEAPIKASVTIERHGAEGWHTLPCNEANYGSCEYEDICPAIAGLDPVCPKELTEKGLQCRCPLKKGKYKLKTMKVPVNTVILEGALHVVLRLSDESGRPLVCADTTMIFVGGGEPITDSHGSCGR